MAFRVVFFFECKGQGWQEVYYSLASGFSAVEDNALTLATQRAKLMSDPCTLVAMRIANEEQTRASTITPLALEANPLYESSADQVSTAQLMRLYSTLTNRHRPLYLRGNPDNVFNEASPNNADYQMWLNEYRTYGAILKGASQWAIKFRPRPDSGNKVLITDWAAATPSRNSAVTLEEALGTEPPFFIQTYQVSGLPFAPGLCKVVAVAGDVLTVRYRTPPDYDYPGGGYAVEFTPDYESITQYASFPSTVRRATGRPFDVERGRRRSILR